MVPSTFLMVIDFVLMSSSAPPSDVIRFRIAGRVIALCIVVIVSSLTVSAQLSVSTAILSDYNSADVSCFGVCDGIGIANPSGGSGSYAYLWEDGQTTQVALNLCAGITTVQVTDLVSLAVVIDSVVLFNPPPLAVDLDPFEFVAGFNISCPGADDGQITATSTGGVGGYSYIWSDGQMGATAIDFEPGLVFVNVMDANFCAVTDSVILTEPDPIQAGSALVLDISCAGRADGLIVPNLVGGSGGYSYLWSDGLGSEIRDGLDTGTYTLNAMDVVGCLFDTNFTIGETPEIRLLVDDITAATCPNSLDGSASISVLGGTSPYQYVWSNGVDTEDQSALAPGTYNVTVTDDRDCAITRPVSIQASSPLNISALKIKPGCGDTDGAIHLSLGGETGTPTFLWSDGQTSASATDLSADRYQVTVMDDLCMISRIFTLDNTSPIELTLSSTASICGGSGSGTATAVPVGGIAPYSWLWSDGQTTETATNLTPGFYDVQVTDSEGCVKWETVEVLGGTDLDINLDLTAPEFCGANNGSIELTPTGGTPPYNYNWSNGASTAAVTGLRSGLYTVVASDGEGCADTLFIALEDDGAASVSISSDPADCGATNGTALAGISGGTAPYLFWWSTGDTSAALASEAPHSGYLCALDAEGCLSIEAYTVGGSEGILADADVFGISCQSIEDGSIDITVLSGTEPFEFSWDDGESTEDRSGLIQTAYTVAILDAGGCQAAGPIEVGDNCDVPLIAVDDVADATEGTDVIVQVLVNDTYPDRPDIVAIIFDDPQHGNAQINFDGSATYSADVDYIGTDSFSYLLCNGAGLCDTAWVYLNVLPEFEIPDAFSPNGDGINDFFEVRGLNEFPVNSLAVFNRWGDEVFRMASYDGSWDGRWKGDQPLADGTYYYVLELGEGNEPKSGYVVIHR